MHSDQCRQVPEHINGTIMLDGSDRDAVLLNFAVLSSIVIINLIR